MSIEGGFFVSCTKSHLEMKNSLNILTGRIIPTLDISLVQ